MLALERRDLGRLAQHRISLVDFRHLGPFHGLAPAVVIEDQQVFACDDLVFIEKLFRPRKIALGIDILDVEFSLGGVLIFRQQPLDVAGNRIVRQKENRDPCLAWHALKEALCFVRKRELLVAGKVPAPVMLKSEVVHHDREHEQDRDLNKNVQTDPNAVDLPRFCDG